MASALWSRVGSATSSPSNRIYGGRGGVAGRPVKVKTQASDHGCWGYVYWRKLLNADACSVPYLKLCVVILAPRLAQHQLQRRCSAHRATP